jgi:hypothetical protein
MRLIHVLPGRSRQTLHAVIAAAEENCAQDVYCQVNPNVEFLHFGTVSAVYLGDTVGKAQPHYDPDACAEVDHK